MDVKRAFEGLTLVAIGGILLANTIGGLPWAVWVSILSLWPLALVAAGVDIIGRSTGKTWVRVVASLITLGALLYGAFGMTPGTWGFPVVFRSGGQAASAYSFEEPRVRGVRTGHARIDAGATHLDLAAGDSLATLEGESPLGLKPSLSASTSGGVADVSVTFGRRNVIGPGFGTQDRTSVTLDRNVRWTAVDVNAGATQLDLDLTGMRVDALSANIGASSLTITYAPRQDTSSEINGGASSVLLRVPKDANVTLKVSGFPVATSVPAGFDRADGGFLGDGTWTRQGTGGDVNVAVSAGAASVELVDY